MSRYMSDAITIPKRKPRAVCAARGFVVHHKIGGGSPWIYPWGGSRQSPFYLLIFRAIFGIISLETG